MTGTSSVMQTGAERFNRTGQKEKVFYEKHDSYSNAAGVGDPVHRMR